MAAPPFTRGSAQLTPHLPPTVQGSPVHAGVRPPTTICALSPVRLPRSRGGPPGLRQSSSASAGAPPFTRGSARLGCACKGYEGGSPVHAGVRPPADRVELSGVGLPRSRGGPPLDVTLPLRPLLAPPFTRGSAPASLRRDRAVGGSPVHAGVRPVSHDHHASLRRLPRSRGGPPQSKLRLGLIGPAPPFTRGSARGSDPRARVG